MPYNTRRKSLSLPSLGIHVPSGSRASSHRSPPTAPPTREQQPPAKKVKRSHASSSASQTHPSPSKSTPTKSRDDPPKSAGRVAENTPPPSPGDVGGYKVDTQGIDDEIVVGVIEQLEKTGNRPHLLKELATVLSNTLRIVESSANQSAIISSRLTSYLRRPWTALAPCPLAKELVGTHPKRIYFYLTNQPRQPIPEPPEAIANSNRIISPSLSSAADEDEERDSRNRRQISPSPEIELHSPDLEDDAIHSPFADQTSFIRDGSHPSASSDASRNRRTMSPALEKEEREFTQAASTLKQWKSQEWEQKREDTGAPPEDQDAEIMDESEESAALRNSEAAVALFGETDSRIANTMFTSSPVMKSHAYLEASAVSRPIQIDTEMRETNWAWDELKSPENVELDELEDLLESY